MPGYRPSFDLTPAILASSGDILRRIGRFEGGLQPAPSPKLRRTTRVRTVQATLAIEGNNVDEEQITAMLEGKRVVGSTGDLRAAENAIRAYARAASFRARSERDFLTAHGLLMRGILADAGRYRQRGVGVMAGERLAHMAPPAKRVPGLIGDLLSFIGKDRETHPLIKSAVVHYEIEFIHPFTDGNGRMGRLWQHVVLCELAPVFAHVPVETVIRARQTEYYSVLAEADRRGNATPFIEFSLRTVDAALESFMRDVKPAPLGAEERLALARAHFKRRGFSRHEYIALLKPISTATASRDLANAVKEGQAERSGDKATARYRFGSR